jgi:hypothetical protein
MLSLLCARERWQDRRVKRMMELKLFIYYFSMSRP